MVDSASLEVKRRARRAKTDRLAVQKLLPMLLRHAAGAKKVWRVGRGPSVVEEDRRQRHRALLTTKRDRTRVLNRITGLLAGSGMRMALHGKVETQREEVRPWDGSPRPTAVRARLKREGQKVPQRTEQSGSVEAARRAALRAREERAMEQGRQ